MGRRMIDVGRVIDAPEEQVWRLLVDTRSWPQWGPSVVAVDCTQRFIGPGSRGRIRTPLGIWLPFQVTCFEAGRAWSWRVASMTTTGHRVEPCGNGRTLLIFEIPLLAAPYRVVCELALSRIAALLEGDAHCRS